MSIFDRFFGPGAIGVFNQAGGAQQSQQGTNGIQAQQVNQGLSAPTGVYNSLPVQTTIYSDKKLKYLKLKFELEEMTELEKVIYGYSNK
jgi:hypothetical protein